VIRDLHRLRRARRDLANTVGALPNVVGTGIGLKQVEKSLTSRPVVIVFVDAKLPADALQPFERVPATFTNRGAAISTDVVEIERPERQVSGPPYFCLDDGNSQGTVTTLARIKGQQNAFCMSCAHCVQGADMNLTTPCAMSLWDDASKGWIATGTYSPPLYTSSGGNGLTGDYGFSDWALFTVSDQAVAHKALGNAPLGTAQPQANVALFGNAAGNRQLTGVLYAIECTFHGWLIDVLVQFTGAPTLIGDSGLLWRDQNGRAVGIHAAAASGYSLCMSARRISNVCAKAGIELVSQYP